MKTRFIVDRKLHVEKRFYVTVLFVLAPQPLLITSLRTNV